MVCFASYTSYEDLTSWKDTKASLLVLAKLNIAYLLLYVFDFSLISLVAYGTLAGLAGSAALVHIARCDIKAEELQKAYDSLATSLKDALSCASKQLVRVITWESWKFNATVAAVAYFILCVTEYIDFSIFFLVMCKIDFDFLYGAQKDKIDTVAGPHIKKLKEILSDLSSKIPRAAGVQKAD